MKISKKILSFIICFAVIMGSMTLNANATEIDKEIVYVDGIAFECYVNDNGELIISSLDDDGQTYLKLDSDGSAESQILNDGVLEEYDLEIQELSEEEVYVEVIDEEDEIVEIYDSLEDLSVDEYEGQSATIGIGVGVAIGTLVTVLLQITVTVIVAGVVYYAVSNVINKIKSDSKKQKYYYKAAIKNHTVYIAFYSGTITKNQAASRLKSGQNVYTFTKKLAKQAVVATGKGYIGEEIHLRKGTFQFYHYHTGNRNGSHSLFGLPYYS